MSNIIEVIVWSLVGGLLSIVGGSIMLLKENLAKKMARIFTPFAAGALLAAAFVDVLPESVHEGVIDTALIWTMVGIMIFFFLERGLGWLHHHHTDKDTDFHGDIKIPLIVIGDTMHNFIDGLAIGAAFLVNPTTGIVTAIVVAAHEIPQEIGDFSLLLSKGLSRAKTLLINVLSALASTVGAVTIFIGGDGININIGMILGLTAGFFIYVSVSDIIPGLHKKNKSKLFDMGSVMMLVGAVLVSLFIVQLHKII